MSQDSAPTARTTPAVIRLRIPAVENSVENPDRKDNNSTIWERLSPEQKREVNKLRDSLG